MTRDSVACRSCERAVVGVNVGDEFVNDVVFPIASGSGVGVEAALVARERVGSNENDFAISWLDKGFVQHGGKINPMLIGPVPRVGAVVVTMKEVNHGIAAIAVFRITGRKVDRNVAIGRVTLKVAFQEFAVDFNVFDRAHRNRRGGSLAGGRTLSSKHGQEANVYKDKDPDKS